MRADVLIADPRRNETSGFVGPQHVAQDVRPVHSMPFCGYAAVAVDEPENFVKVLAHETDDDLTGRMIFSLQRRFLQGVANAQRGCRDDIL